MIEKVYSKLKQDTVLHLIFRLENNSEESSRQDIVDADNFLQCSYLKMPKNKTFKPHKHIFKNRQYDNQIAQESWVVIRGSVKCVFYDLDDTIIATPVLYPGDASFTLQGGHTYEILEDDTIVYEYKTGPYEGQKYDKEFIC